MKDSNFATGLILGIVLTLSLFWISLNKKVIDYPEEISQAHKGQLLKVESVTKDTIKLGFYGNIQPKSPIKR